MWRQINLDASFGFSHTTHEVFVCLFPHPVTNRGLPSPSLSGCKAARTLPQTSRLTTSSEHDAFRKFSFRAPAFSMSDCDATTLKV
jgi:hypothetical protein